MTYTAAALPARLYRNVQSHYDTRWTETSGHQQRANPTARLTKKVLIDINSFVTYSRRCT